MDQLLNFKSLKTNYFWVAVVFIGTAGVWLPVLLSLGLDEKVKVEEIPINLTTFYISIYFAGCVDSIFRNIDFLENKYELKSRLFRIVILILLSIVLVVSTVWLKIKSHFFIPLLLSLLGAFIGLRLWWNNNRENPTFSEIIRRESNQTHGGSW